MWQYLSWEVTLILYILVKKYLGCQCHLWNFHYGVYGCKRAQWTGSFCVGVWIFLWRLQLLSESVHLRACKSSSFCKSLVFRAMVAISPNSCQYSSHRYNTNFSSNNNRLVWIVNVEIYEGNWLLILCRIPE